MDVTHDPNLTSVDTELIETFRKNLDAAHRAVKAWEDENDFIRDSYRIPTVDHFLFADFFGASAHGCSVVYNSWSQHIRVLEALVASPACPPEVLCSVLRSSLAHWFDTDVDFLEAVLGHPNLDEAAFFHLLDEHGCDEVIGNILDHPNATEAVRERLAQYACGEDHSDISLKEYVAFHDQTSVEMKERLMEELWG